MAGRLSTRLAAVEAELKGRSTEPLELILYWHDELTPCPSHPRCHVEVATGLHNADVVVLTWERHG